MSVDVTKSRLLNDLAVLSEQNSILRDALCSILNEAYRFLAEEDNKKRKIKFLNYPVFVLRTAIKAFEDVREIH